MKHRIFAVIFALAIYLASQMAGSLHTAAYGPGEHKHHGRICDIYLHADQTKLSPPPAGPEMYVPIYCGATYTPIIFLALPDAEYPSGLPRAPPALLLV